MQDHVEARAVKKDGESFRVTITTGQDGLLLEGITGLVVGERLSLVLADGEVRTLSYVGRSALEQERESSAESSKSLRRF